MMRNLTLLLPLFYLLSACGPSSPEKNAQAQAEKSAQAQPVQGASTKHALTYLDASAEPDTMEEFKAEMKKGCIAEGQRADYCDCYTKVSVEVADKEAGGGGGDITKLDEKLAACAPMMTPSK